MKGTILHLNPFPLYRKSKVEKESIYIAHRVCIALGHYLQNISLHFPFLLGVLLRYPVLNPLMDSGVGGRYPIISSQVYRLRRATLGLDIETLVNHPPINRQSYTTQKYWSLIP